jgi:UvrD-like helicase C-terminal domain
VFTQNIPTVELTEPMRNNTQPGLMNIVAQLRDTVRTGVFKPIQAVKGVIDWVDDVGLEHALNVYHKVQSYDHRIMVYTNDRVMAYNGHIREMRGLTDAYHVGEILVAANSTQRSDYKFSVEKKFTVIAVHEEETVDFGEDISFRVKRLDLRDTRGGVYTNVRVPAEPEHYRQLLNWLKKDKRWGIYYTFQETYLELRPHDAATVYKGQGNSHNVVIIDLSNIATCHNPDQVARMLYVGFSRARIRVIMYGDLPAKYGSVLPAV